MFYEKYYSHVEAILFASGDPITVEKIAKILDIPNEHVEDIIFDLKEEFKKPIHGMTIRQVAGGYQLCTKLEVKDTINLLAQNREQKLSQATLETLAIVAFKQPITKQEIEFIRGVKTEKIINSLLEIKLIKEAGRKEAVGRPILYATTDEFLTAFGLNSLRDLPNLPEGIFDEKITETLSLTENE